MTPTIPRNRDMVENLERSSCDGFFPDTMTGKHFLESFLTIR